MRPMMRRAAPDALNSIIARRGDSPQLPEALLAESPDSRRTRSASRKETLETYRLLEERGGNDYASDSYAGIMRNTDNYSERMKYAALVKNSSGLSADRWRRLNSTRLRQ